MTIDARQEMQPRLTTEQRLERIDRTLSRICAEIDIVFRAVRALLAERAEHQLAEKLADEYEALKSEADEDVEEDVATRDTMPPDEL